MRTRRLTWRTKFKVGLGIAFLLSLVFLFRFPNVRYLPESLWYLGEPSSLVLPVDGLSPAAIRSTWHAQRSGNREHEGVDLFAPKGTRVLSVTRGTVWKLGKNRLGGTVVWVLGKGPALYYYAHLSRIEPSLTVGQRVEQGAVLGYVGNTGNARGTPAHLHFGIYRLRWTGQYPIDPVPWLLERGIPMPRPKA